MTKVAPFIRVADAELSAEWYARLGFSVEWRTRAQPHLPLFVAISNGDALIFLSEHTGDAHPDGLLYLYVDDVDAIAADFGDDRRARLLRHARDRAHRSRRQPAQDRHTRRRVTVRKSSYRSLRSLQRDNARCRACLEAGFQIESWPVRAPYHGQRAYLFGQAPGIVEGQERLPWRGRAGQTLRRWLELEGDELYETLLLRVRDALLSRARPRRAAATGRRPRASRISAQFWRDWELELLRPELIVTVGGLALRRLLGIGDADGRDREELSRAATRS